MMTSIQTCLPNNNCKQPLSSVVRSSSFLRPGGGSLRQNAVHRKSAVERLEESKANYVKSERVLDSKQSFKHSSCLQLSSRSHLDFLIMGTSKHSHTYETLNGDCRTVGQQRPVIRARAKSQSESRDIHVPKKLSPYHPTSQMTENLEQLTLKKETEVSHHKYAESPERAKVHRGNSDPVPKENWISYQPNTQKSYNIHKSMPDLSPAQAKLAAQAYLQSPSESSRTSSFGSSHLKFEVTPRPRLFTTPDYVTRSSSFKCDIYSDENNEKYVTKSDLDELLKQTNQQKSSNVTSTLNTPSSENSGMRRKPVLRSKSDIGYRYGCNHHPTSSQRMTAQCIPELERFFNNMGLESSVWKQLTGTSTTSSPPQFFGSGSSINTDDHQSHVCSEDSFQDEWDGGGGKDGLRGQDLRDHGPLETSIVEKNARVIKWLFNCRKAMESNES
ncbi:protein FAM110B-like [Limulus polyphemus]|uniref:Protein FAM110B-like n=1 Tax=Limulus polyphemus TaxID=6850 RepID=A0ABM1B8T7_LIMPO|nr:protein FAM110B-like [Limulus polyphemus]XP_022247570.1 protein FAM110B-like [Limulus polyphemus]XP_022247616.1 protein FAM110B-like [Limulus polyphemus]XP_022247667.1 protein FAM110B-like [Limulus polyphemus]